MERLFVTADDRTGALEVAGALAERLGRSVRVAALGVEPAGADDAGDAPCDLVVDLGSRHLAPESIGDVVATAVGRVDMPIDAHKFDSTLRGNWALELAAIHRLTQSRVLIVPALPAAGRVCTGGVVLVDGVPVADTALGRDPRRPVLSSRPVEHLVAAGVESVASIRTGADLESWLRNTRPAFAVVDAVSDDDLRRVGHAWRTSGAGVILAGTSAAVASGVPRLGAASAAGGSWPIGPAAQAVLVVCGSLHPTARRQVAALTAWTDAGDRVAIVTTAPPWPQAAPVADDAAAAARSALAERARRALLAVAERAVVVLGGDTTEALLGDAVLDVAGTLGTGVSWSRDVAAGRLVVTRAGGFGADGALVELVEALLVSSRGAAGSFSGGTLCR